MTTHAMAVEMKELNLEEIDAVGGGMLAHLLIVAAVAVLCVVIVLAKEGCTDGTDTKGTSTPTK